MSDHGEAYCRKQERVCRRAEVACWPIGAMSGFGLGAAIASERASTIVAWALCTLVVTAAYFGTRAMRRKWFMYADEYRVRGVP